MKKKTDTRRVDNHMAKRILVTLDQSGYGMNLLRLAAGMAAGLQGELLGLLVEDINLIRLAELPFSREVNIFAESDDHFCLESLEKQLRFQADHLRENLAAIAKEQKIPWSFRLARGRLAAEIMTAMGETDMLIMGRMQRVFPPSLRLFSDFTEGRSVVEEGFLIRGLRQPIMVFFNGTASSGRALTAALLLAGKNSERLVVILPRLEPGRLLELEQRLFHGTRQSSRKPRFLSLANHDLSALVQLGRRHHAGVLILGQDSFSLGEEHIMTLLGYPDYPVVLVK